MKNYICFIVFSSLFIFLSCNVSTDTKDLNKLTIHLQDENKNPIENAGLHFFVDFNQGYKQRIGFNKTEGAGLEDSIPANDRLYQNYPNPFNPQTHIMFSLLKSTSATLRIVDRLDSTLVLRTIIDSNLQAGMYAVQWDGKNDEGKYLTNTIYTYQFVTDEFRDSKNLFINMIDPAQIKSLNCIPLATSDAKGDIEVDYTVFPIKEAIIWLDEKGSELGVLTVPASIHLVFIKDRYITQTKAVTIIPDKPLDLTVTLEKE